MPIKKLRSDAGDDFKRALNFAHNAKIRCEERLSSLSEPLNSVWEIDTSSQKIAYEEMMHEIRIRNLSSATSDLSGQLKKIGEMQAFLETGYLVSPIKPVQLDDKVFSLGNDAGKYDLWLYQNGIFGITGSYSNAEKELLILDFADKERQKFERLAAKFSDEQTEHIKHERTRIPENVRIEVWRRDQGKCAGCGSREKLEYDHIVPLSRGGSNTARNVELLCEVCNRSKGDRIQ